MMIFYVSFYVFYRVNLMRFRQNSFHSHSHLSQNPSYTAADDDVVVGRIQVHHIVVLA